jgi:hypothetical protein
MPAEKRRTKLPLFRVSVEEDDVEVEAGGWGLL